MSFTESWYLVSYEDDCNLRVLHEDEVHHIFPEDNEEELQVGDIASALWLPNGQYYDAKVLQIGGLRMFSTVHVKLSCELDSRLVIYFLVIK